MQKLALATVIAVALTTPVAAQPSIGAEESRAAIKAAIEERYTAPA